VIGRAIHVHANPDDCTDPTGNGGARIAQCVIGTSAQTSQSFPNGVPTSQDATPCQILYGNATAPIPCVTIENTILQRTSKVCLNFGFSSCQFSVALVVDGIKIYSPPPLPITGIRNFVQQNEVCNDAFLGCQLCLSWSNFTLNQNLVAGCGIATFKCAGFRYGSFPVGCFSDTQVIPRCFGNCPNLCNYNGICTNGKCECTPSFQGADCSISAVNCPNDCGGKIRGTCVNNVCACKSPFSGSDCSAYSGTTSTTQNGVGWKVPLIATLVIVGVLGIAGAAVGLYFYRKKRSATQFSPLEESNQLELEDEE